MELLATIAVLCISVFLLLLVSYKVLEWVTIRVAVRHDDRFDEMAAEEIRKRLKKAVEARRGLLENKRAARLDGGRASDMLGWEGDIRQFVVAHGRILETRREQRVFDERFDDFRRYVDRLLAAEG